MIQLIETRIAPRSDLRSQTANPKITKKQVDTRNLKVGRPLTIHHFGIVAVTLLTCNPVFADVNSVANNVMNYSDNKVLSAGMDMAEAVSANAPVRVDKITVMLGAVFVRQTKTFIYKYETSQALDPTVGKKYVFRHTCADPIRKAFMYRGVVFRHAYITPSGQQMFDVRYSDC